MFKQMLRHFLKIIAPLLLLTACSTARPILDYNPEATLETLSAAVSMSVVTADNGMSGSGFMIYRRPDQLHLVLLSPFSGRSAIVPTCRKRGDCRAGG